MARQAALGNGNMLALFDSSGYLRDLYYPYAGFENHVVSLKHRVGIKVNDVFTWLHETESSIEQNPETFKVINKYTLKNPDLLVTIESLIYNEKNILVRKTTFENNCDIKKDIEIFFNQEFKIKENKYRNTGYYYPEKNVIVHYRGNRAFLVNIISQTGGIDDYTIGMYKFDNKLGSYKDAEDGKLSKNPVEHGPVDSVVSKKVTLGAFEKQTIYYCLTAERSIENAIQTNHSLNIKPPEHIFKTTCDYWQAWKNQRDISFEGLSKEATDTFYRSLYMVRIHADKKSGGIIASGDTTHYEYGKDSYAYVWPRDAYFPAKAMIKLGYLSIAQKLFDFFEKVLTPQGYMMHKFEQDTSTGSSWHPWINDGVAELPIQEDETAVVVNLMYDYFKTTRDIEFVENHFNNLVEKCANFMCTFVNKKMGLPEPSYDLWEAKYMVTTYTTCSVISALKKASYLSKKLGKEELYNRYENSAKLLEKGLIKHLYKNENESFVKGIYTNNDGEEKYTDYTVDSSTLFGLWYFDILDPKDPKFEKTKKLVDAKLKLEDFFYIRFENDTYFKEEGKQPNPWIITTLWNIQLKLKYSNSAKELKEVAKLIDKFLVLKTPSGLLPEQVLLDSKKATGYCPLVWSHATYLETIAMYIEKMEILGLSKPCLPK